MKGAIAGGAGSVGTVGREVEECREEYLIRRFGRGEVQKEPTGLGGMHGGLHKDAGEDGLLEALVESVFLSWREACRWA
jgi:hypothetical protein